jgi:hypothetical protein
MLLAATTESSIGFCGLPQGLNPRLNTFGWKAWNPANSIPRQGPEKCSAHP